MKKRWFYFFAILATVSLAPLTTMFFPSWSDDVLSGLEFGAEAVILITVLSSSAKRSYTWPFALSTAALFVGDTFYSLRVLKILTIPLNNFLNIVVECTYGIFILAMLVTVTRALGGLKAFRSKWLWICLLFLAFVALNTKFVFIPYCGQDHPDILSLNAIIYGIANSALLACALPFAIRTTDRLSHWFLQLTVMFLIADFGIRYQAVQVNISHFSWAEPGWCMAFVGLAWLCVADRKQFSFLIPSVNFVPFISIRSLLTLAICGANILFLLAGLFFGIYSIKTGGDLSGILFLLYVFWFVANEFSIWLERDFQAILPYMFQATKHLSPEGTLNLYLEKVRTKTSIYEINQVLESYNGLVDQENKLAALSRQMARDKALVEIASQVSHDIRSPLSALNILCATAKELSLESRTLMKGAVTRINDIANDLLNRYKKMQLSSQKEPRLVSLEIEQIVSEKRLQIRGRTAICVEYKTASVRSAFAELDAKEFKRAVSNLINNSLEAFFDRKGDLIEIIVEDFEPRTIKLTVKDNGPGIRPDVLARLRASETVTTKEKGFGLGFSHARKTIESLGGRIQILSTEGAGAAIEIYLSKASAPDWFCGNLAFGGSSKVVVLDDDVSVHRTWSDRFGSSGIPYVCFTTGSEFKKWCSEKKHMLERAIFLVDFELLLQPQSGLDIVEEVGVTNKTILVTYRFDDPMIRERCRRLRVKILPKVLIDTVPLVTGVDAFGPLL